jgi:glycine hydroxymethyltransferase
VENLCIERGKKLFGFEHLNVQPYSGSPANSEVLMALINVGEPICGLKLSSGGHLTHGHPKITFSGKYFRSIQYEVDQKGRIDFDQLEELVRAERPKLIFAGTTAYPYILDFKKFAEIADKFDAWLVADIAHIAGLVAAGVHPSPVPYAHIITSTTHKSLRGPRGAFIGVTQKGLEKDPDLAKKIDRAVFPGMQGGPHENIIGAMAVTFAEAMKPAFKQYARQVVSNAAILAKTLKDLGWKVYGTENHLMLVEVGLGKGKAAAVALEKADIFCNANTVPGEQGSPLEPSGIRLGSPAETTKGKKEADFVKIGQKIDQILRANLM